MTNRHNPGLIAPTLHEGDKMAPRYIDQETLLAREHEMLDQALKIIDEQGLAFLTIDKLVANVNYSKGTVYNHFSSKEDLFTALCNRNMRQMLELFERANSIEYSARSKMTAIGYAYMLKVLLLPQSFNMMMNAKTEFFEKATQERSQEHEHLDNSILNLCSGVVAQAFENGELSASLQHSIQDITFSIYSMAFGTVGLLLKRDRTCSGTIGFMLQDRVLAHGNIVMDSFGWKQGEDRTELLQHLQHNVYAKEIAKLKSLGVDFDAGVDFTV